MPGITPLGEGGLLGLALRPDAGGSTWVYAYQTVGGEGSPSTRWCGCRSTGSPPSTLALGAPEALLDGIPASARHNGGRLAFGPDDLLYVTTGDAGDTALSQDPASLGGKILRLTPDGDPAPGNPVGARRCGRSATATSRASAGTTDGRMFASEFGQNTFDEVNLIEPGGQLRLARRRGRGRRRRDYVDPLVTWGTDEASPSRPRA